MSVSNDHNSGFQQHLQQSGTELDISFSVMVLQVIPATFWFIVIAHGRSRCDHSPLVTGVLIVSREKQGEITQFNAARRGMSLKICGYSTIMASRFAEGFTYDQLFTRSLEVTKCFADAVTEISQTASR